MFYTRDQSVGGMIMVVQRDALMPYETMQLMKVGNMVELRWEFRFRGVVELGLKAAP